MRLFERMIRCDLRGFPGSETTRLLNLVRLFERIRGPGVTVQALGKSELTTEKKNATEANNPPNNTTQLIKSNLILWMWMVRYDVSTAENWFHMV